MPELLDIALRYDAETRRCDAVVAGDDFLLDTTAETPLLISLGTDARAEPDDLLPDDPLPVTSPVVLLGRRRGWVGDALDDQGRTSGCRLWLLARAKADESTRRAAEEYAVTATAWLATEYGVLVTIAAEWLSAGVLGLRAAAGAADVTLRQRVAG